MSMYSSEKRPTIKCGPSRTKQGFRKQCDINHMIEKYRANGIMPNTNTRQPFYGDVSNIKNYQESLDVVIKAREMFDALPVKMRERFDYDPAKMVAFFEDPGNLPEALAKGWVTKRPDAAVSPEVVPPGVSAPSGATEPSSGAGGAPKAS